MSFFDETEEKIYDYFDKRISQILFIKRFAEENNISYSQSKKIYKQRYSEEAQLISEIASKNQVPYELIISMIKDDGLSFSQINSNSINKKIYEDYFKDNTKNKDLLLIKDYSGYIKEIRRRLGTSAAPNIIPIVIDEIQKDILEFAQKNNVSSAIATLCVCYKYNITQAKKIIYFLTYNENNNIESSNNIEKDFVKFLNMNTIFKRINLHGIDIISPNWERLDYLAEIVEQAFKKGNDTYKKQLELLAKENKLILSDLYYLEDSLIGAYENESNFIFINSSYNQNLVDVFYHESSHFIDSKTGINKKTYSAVEERVWDVFKKIGERINGKPYDNILNNPNVPRTLKNIIKIYANTFNKGITEKGIDYKREGIKRLAISYIYDPAMTEKWKKEIEEEYKPETIEDCCEYLFQKRKYEREKYFRLIASIYDIYDGLARGMIYEKYTPYGHGRDYYSSNKNRIIEFIAQIGVFYNNDCMDVLVYEFGEELAKELIEIYKGLLQKRKEINERQKEIEQKASQSESQQIDNENNISPSK